MKLHNVMEDIVLESFEENINSLNLTCQCKKCMLDIVAIAINSLPTQYIVRNSNRPYVKAKYIGKQYEVNVLSKLASAAKIVAENPLHE